MKKILFLAIVLLLLAIVLLSVLAFFACAGPQATQPTAPSTFDVSVNADGFVVINGFNIGRYFNPAGPQKTLYVPAPILKEGRNEIIVFESDKTDSLTVEFLDTPEL